MVDETYAAGGAGCRAAPSLLSLMREDARANVIRPSALRATLGLINNPGLLCVALYRVSAQSYPRGKFGRLFGLLIWRLNVFATGAYLHPEARIGPGLRLPHPVGVVVGAGVRLGAYVTLYQNTTMGISSEEKYETYPTIHDNVVIYCGAVIVGGVCVGAHAVVGANAVVVKDVPAAATVVGIPARIISSAKPTPQPAAFRACS